MSGNDDELVTFEEREEEEEETEPGGLMLEDEPSLEIPGREELAEDLEEQFEGIGMDLRLLPEEWLKDEGPGFIPEPSEPRERFEVINNVQTPEPVVDIVQQDIDFGQVAQDINQALGANLAELDNRNLLVVIAQSVRSLTALTAQQAQVNVEQLSGIFDLLTAVEPHIGITVSGVNTIEQSNVTQPVVPESERINIPSRTLMIKASNNNKESIAFGDDSVAPTNGFILFPGESIAVSIDLREVNLFMSSDNSGDEVQLLGMI